VGWRSAARGSIPYAVAAASGFLLAYVLVYLFVFPTPLVPDDRPVPDVRGLLVDDADRTLRDAGFAVQDAGARVNASVPAGTVLEQSPAPSTRKPAGATVTITAAAAP
jgi:beta-lactam-binding protein with PASTA domain